MTRFAELLDLAVAGDPVAAELFRQRARLTGRAAAVLLDMFDPEVLVVVEPGTGRLPACMDELRTEVEARSVVCDDAGRSVVPSSFTGSVLATAGAAVALGALHDDPLGPWPALPAVSYPDAATSGNRLRQPFPCDRRPLSKGAGRRGGASSYRSG
ncbi:hypothetical protein [Streptomyces sp. 147326]|uniref:hypothetical protein n=1 Tax=Streptomyces sp. 147326 TaxID=3074379 RepID=UPI003857E604